MFVKCNSDDWTDSDEDYNELLGLKKSKLNESWLIADNWVVGGRNGARVTSQR